MQKMFLILSLFIFSSCGTQDLADRDDGRGDNHEDHRHDDDRDDHREDHRNDDYRDDRRSWWSS